MSTEDDKALALKVAISAATSLVAMVVDFGWLFPHELEVVWPNISSSRYAKLYVFSRYLGLCSHMMYFGIPSTDFECRMWYGFQAIVVEILLASVEGALMHRVYALFLHSRWILLVLCLFAACQLASMAVSARFAVPSDRHTETCLVTKPHPGNAYFGATTMTTNILIFFMTFWKYIRLPMKWTHGSIGRVVFRDSAISLIAISLMMLFLTLCALEVVTPSMSGNFSYYWLVCILWISIGRIIINHQKMSLEVKVTSSTLASPVPFTSEIDIQGSSWGNVTGTLSGEVGSTGGEASRVSTSTLESGALPIALRPTESSKDIPIKAHELGDRITRSV
ncbi:hypothetical protein PAXRUDRAFT_337043 [Paxillus rubicundulus Ve08.2h10]|uniref:Uncharacterized protein n=1 Tax=Paxillus rubicundulus Ve08.2h10 TaxID=930991 RepID=A0A0D0E9T9_9AGAM|nr:hypothetical protein PAXRUDRAFT_337043 [Paxillus rubicundulus Ve08.2h10]